MNKCNISEKIREQITAKPGLVGLGVKIRQLGILTPIEDEVKIAQLMFRQKFRHEGVSGFGK
jgi:hypothetical protein